MKVKYDASLWNKEGAFYGIAQKTAWQFEHDNLERCIPCIYRFAEGVVFDLLTFLDEDAVAAYFDKYKDIEDKLTDRERRTAEQESPYKEINIKELHLNGIKIKHGYSSSSLVMAPFLGEAENAKFLQEGYRRQLGNTTCFLCQRFRVPYPASASATEKLLRKLHLNKIYSLKIVTENTSNFYIVEAATVLSEDKPSTELKFQSPIDGVKYTLYLQKDEDIEIPQHENHETLFVTGALYEIEPALPQGQQLQFDTSISCHTQLADGFAPRSASAIGIIGGSCGPTALFVADKEKPEIPLGAHGLPLHSCFSKITQGKQSAAEFHILGIDQTLQDSTTYLLGR